MATTTNYGWTTPDDTDLVKDGAAAIRTLGSSVDTTTKNLNPETTLGDMSFRSATSNVNTRLPIGSSGQHLTVVAGVPAWATASDQTPLTTKGDIFTFSTLDARLGVGANGTVLQADSAEATGLKWATPSDQTPLTTKGDLFTFSTIDARLGVGTNNHVLTADSAEATGLKWAAPAAGGMTLISTTTLSGASTTISVSSNTYIDLIMQIENIDCSVDENVVVQLNGETGATAYAQVNLGANNGSADLDYALTNGIRLEVQGYGSTGENFVNVQLFNANSTIRKVVSVNGGGLNGANKTVINNTATVASTAVISSIVIKPLSGSFDAGTVKLYGVK